MFYPYNATCFPQRDDGLIVKPVLSNKLLYIKKTKTKHVAQA